MRRILILNNTHFPRLLSVLILIITFCTAADAASTSWNNQTTIANALGWHEMHESKNRDCQLCGGYYTEPKAISDVPNPPNPKNTPITITSKGPTVFRADGVSVLRQDVVVQQPGRIIHADRAYLYHDKKSGKITRVVLIGHVKIQEHGKLLVGENAEYDFVHNTFTIHDVVYHIVGEHILISTIKKFNAWGTAKKIHRNADGTIDLTEASYSTCPPLKPAWTIHAKTMHLDRAAEEGYAKNTVIQFKNVPVFYTPYYSFPLTSHRKSGLLPPSGGYATGHGFYFAFPYYWNIAPNYDAILTPQWYTYRGLQLNGLFRYLTPFSDGRFYASIIPHDREFSTFRKNTLFAHEGDTTSSLAPYLSALQNSKSHRAFFDFDSHVEFNQYWKGKFYARYVTDPYFAEDFQSEYLSQNTNQIPSSVEFEYQGDHWQDIFSAQSYQTLHPIDQTATPAQNQYVRLPDITMNATYPNFIPNLNFNLSAQAVRFDYHSAFTPLTYQMPIGTRFHLRPSISRPFTWPAFYFTPQLSADNTTYFSQLAASTNTTPRSELNNSRTLPIFNVDTGLYFDRMAHFGKSNYIQTLEPRLFYLYTPYLNQDRYPNFDTLSLPFSISNLYSLNEFSGFDRLQNANQLSVGLSSDILRANDASDVLNAQVGLINYFDNPRVCLLPGCKQVSKTISPITGALTWNPNTLWQISSQAAWDTALKQLNNAQITTQYRIDEQRIAILGYQFTHGNPDTPFDAYGFSTNTSLLTAGLVWPVTLHWHFFGYTYYDLTHHRPQNQYVGLSYSTCCWAVRTILADNFIGTTSGSSPINQYSTSYYIEFLLKGLGSAGNRRAEDMLTTTLPGFSDLFSNHGHYGYQ